VAPVGVGASGGTHPYYRTLPQSCPLRVSPSVMPYVPSSPPLPSTLSYTGSYWEGREERGAGVGEVGYLIRWEYTNTGIYIDIPPYNPSPPCPTGHYGVLPRGPPSTQS